MGKPPLAVAIAALIADNHILLIRRSKGDYAGLLGLPGGKIEKDEHLSEAAVREIHEETGIESDFSSLLGVVSEHLVEDGNIIEHFILHVCELEPKSTQIGKDQEATVGWYSLAHLHEMRDEIIPSDLLMIERLINLKEKTYYDCILRKQGDTYQLEKFE